MNSAIYFGNVSHVRNGRARHRFRHRLPWFLFDLDELSELAERLPRWLFAVNRPAVFSFCEADHGARDGASYRTWLTNLAERHGIVCDRFEVLCLPRIFGFVFNPLTVVYCYDGRDKLSGMIYEVHNTFGDGVHYVYRRPAGYRRPVRSSDGLEEHSIEKTLHVSPFFGTDGCYRFSVRRPGLNVAVAIHYDDEAGSTLRADFAGSRRAFGRPQLISTLFCYPLATLGVVADTLWQAAQLWVKGIPVHRRRPSVPSKSMSNTETQY